MTKRIEDMMDAGLKQEYFRLAVQGMRGDEDRFEEIIQALMVRGQDPSLNGWADLAASIWEQQTICKKHEMDCRPSECRFIRAQRINADVRYQEAIR